MTADACALRGRRRRIAHASSPSLPPPIWREYWPAFLGTAQTEYMVEQFQSLPAIERDMREYAYEYWFIHAADDDRVVGYTGGHVEPETNRFFISKIYLLAAERGKRFRKRGRPLL